MKARTAAALALLLAAPAVEAGPLRAYPRAAQRGRTAKLLRGLDHKRSYARTLAAEELAPLAPSERGAEKLLACVSDTDERDWVRSACASTLASWQVDGAVPTIASALGGVGAEARLWMADALHRLGGPEARAALAGLTTDADLFVSTAARHWTR